MGRIHVKWETYYKKDKISQCHRCQSYGHGSLNCNQAPKCVRCAGEHLTENCVMEKDNPNLLKCINCNGNHTANYKKCPIYITKINEKESSNNANKNSRPPKYQNPLISNARPVNSQVSYASIASGNFNNNNNNNTNMNTNFIPNYEDFNTLIHELKELNTACNLKEMINLVRCLKIKLQNCSSNFDKLVILSELAEDNK